MMANTELINDNCKYLALYEQQRDRITAETSNCVLSTCTQLRKHQKCEPNRLTRLDDFLGWLATEVLISPTLARETKLDSVLRLVFEPDQRWVFPEQQRTRAKALHERFSAINWGKTEEDERRAAVEAAIAARDQAAPDVVSSFDKSDKDPPASSSKPAKTSAPAALRIPDQHHPVFGRGGIMWGLAYDRNSTMPSINPECPKRDCKVFGHNGLTVGDWWPRQLAALVHGAHGSAQGGISGTQDVGAYSIVVSGTYEGLDRDQGDIVYYSGSNSHDNRDPKNPPTSSRGTLALKASIISQQPVRVLRADSGKSRYSPSYGLRYDGLYRVVGCNNMYNKHGGMYEQFKLERLAGQVPLSSIARPTGQEVIDFHSIVRGY